MAIDPLNPADGRPDAVPSAPSVEQLVTRLDRLYQNAHNDPADSSNNLTGVQVGRYSIGRVLGRGGFGIVYQARDEKLERDVALKIPRAEVLLDRDKLRRFEHEARMSAGLDHPAIVPVLEAELIAPTPYIASAYCPGPNLAQWQAAHTQAVDWRAAADFIAQLAEGVHYAHQQGVVHRDLKPSNVMLVPRADAPHDSARLDDHQPRLTDFGLAKLAEENALDTRSSLLLGTPIYMAPEQVDPASSTEISGSVDVYSLGVMLFELLTGELPIEGSSYIQMVDQLRNAPPRRVRAVRPELPRQIEAICAKCLEKDPVARYASAADLAADLKSLLRGEKLSVRQASPWDRFRYWVSQPQRVRDAGWFSLCLQTWMTGWLCTQAMVLPSFNMLTPAEYRSTLIEVTQILLAVHIPLVVIAWFTLKNQRWAVWTGLFLSVPSFIWPFVSLMGFVEVFALVYRGAPYHAFSGKVLVSGAMFIQLMLYAFAAASLRNKQATPRQKELFARHS
jgi:serine/threonine protein kinase